MKQNEIKKDLRSLSGLLSNWGKNVKNPNILQAINVSESPNTDLNYSILLSDPLTFTNIDLDRHCLPQGIEKIPEKDITFEIKLTLTCSESKDDKDFIDPIKSLGVNIIIAAVYEEAEELKDVNCSWHLDKGNPSGATFSHPIYHMNFGGSYMTKQGNIFGKLFLLSAPRIIHPPMDIILSCDFIIRNFYEKKNHQKITTLPAYRELIDNAKTRYWKSYCEAFYSKWHTPILVGNLSHNDLIGH